MPPTNPDWYHNLLAHPEVEVEFGAERFAAEAVPVTGPERDRLFAAQVAQNPAFGDYEKTTAAGDPRRGAAPHGPEAQPPRPFTPARTG